MLTQFSALRGKPRQLPFYGRMLFAGNGGNLEYLPFVRYRSVRVLGTYHNKLVSAEIVGDSLSEAGIYDGDVAVIELTQEIKNGQLVAALTPSGMMAKYFYREADGAIRLESRNRTHQDKIFAEHQVAIQGIVREVVRRLN